jgi:hypothetical protein
MDSPLSIVFTNRGTFQLKVKLLKLERKTEKTTKSPPEFFKMRNIACEINKYFRESSVKKRMFLGRKELTQEVTQVNVISEQNTKYGINGNKQD